MQSNEYCCIPVVAGATVWFTFASQDSRMFDHRSFSAVGCYHAPKTMDREQGTSKPGKQTFKGYHRVLCVCGEQITLKLLSSDEHEFHRLFSGVSDRSLKLKFSNDF